MNHISLCQLKTGTPGGTGLARALMIITLALSLQGCVGLLIGAATDAAIETAKIPFKVGGAVIDVVTGDDDEEDE